MKVGFDALCLAAVVHEAQACVGGRVQRVISPSPDRLILSVYKNGEFNLLLTVDARFARAHFVTRRPSAPPAEAWLTEWRRRLLEGTVVFVRQRGCDRILEIGVHGAEGAHVVVAELMGKHSNVMLVDADARVMGALKWVGPRQSRRPIQPGRVYVPPPFEERVSLLEVGDVEAARGAEGWSPTLAQFFEAGVALDEVQRGFRDGFEGGYVIPGRGAYPLDPGRLGVAAVRVETFSRAAEKGFGELEQDDALATAQRSLQKQMERVLLAREVALRDIEEARAQAAHVPKWQTWGELILAYQGQIAVGDTEARVWDYNGAEVVIPLRDDQTPLENAERLFAKAKKAKARVGELSEQAERIGNDVAQLEAFLERVAATQSVREVEDLKEEATQRRWFFVQTSGGKTGRAERPWDGHPIRELLSPGGWRVLYGDNSSANDYLTTKVAKPNDYWLHVRGGPSAHVVLQTHNQPLRVQRADLEFAARVAVRQSPSKHSALVSVDYTLKKYVRKPKGSAPGLAVYTHEKTIHVEIKG